MIARAKLNLRLTVGALGGDGYHPVRSLMVELDGPEDRLRVRRASRRSVVCPGAEGRDNLCWASVDALERRFERELPVEIVIDKGIPSQAGLGGGSADAAAALGAVARVYDLPVSADEIEALAAEVGSDVPFFVRGGAQWATGRGERLSPARTPSFAAVVARPDVRLSTPAVYGAFDRLPAPGPPPAGEAPDMPALAHWVDNDLWAPALALRPALGATTRSLAAGGARAVLLCGSGSCVAGLVHDRDEAERLKDAAGLAEAWVAEPYRRRPDRPGH